MEHVQICAGGDLMEKIPLKPLNFHNKLAKRRPCENIGKHDFREGQNMIKHENTCWNFQRGGPGRQERGANPEKNEEVHMETRTTSSIDFVESSKVNVRSMSSAKPLREFDQMDWVPINFGEMFDKRRPYPNQNGWQELWR
jgi:hypothetical protein